MKRGPAGRAKVSSAPAGFRRALLSWYGKNARALPWRETRDPYRIWVSEIMLQQTRVAAVEGYYRRFLSLFPDVDTLAAASEQQVLAAWSGLGYYRRARMMLAAARMVRDDFGSQLPADLDGLRSLPGIGRYTAAAIGSIAFQLPAAVVDGNVERVLLRCLGPRKSQPSFDAWQAAQALIDPIRPGDFNQAMMELGATVCTPKSPNCAVCPIKKFCRTRGPHRTVARSPRRQRAVHYALAQHGGRVLMVQRPCSAKLMPGMWELPEIAAPKEKCESLCRARHSITTTDYRLHLHGLSRRGLPGKMVAVDSLPILALTGAARKLLRLAGLLPR